MKAKRRSTSCWNMLLVDMLSHFLLYEILGLINSTCLYCTWRHFISYYICSLYKTKENCTHPIKSQQMKESWGFQASFLSGRGRSLPLCRAVDLCFQTRKACVAKMWQWIEVQKLINNTNNTVNLHGAFVVLMLFNWSIDFLSLLYKAK